MHPVDLVIRGRRVVTEHGIGPASVHITRGYISSISIFEDVPAGAELVEAIRFRRDAGPGRYSCTRQRTWPHRLGRIRDGDACGSRGRCHDDRGHAAEFNPGDDNARRLSKRNWQLRRASYTWTQRSGAASCRETQASWQNFGTPAWSASNVF